MIPRSAHTPETLQLLRDVLEDTWAALPPHERKRTSKTNLAMRLVEMAAAGERDPARLRSAALSTVVTPV
jgi:hypothetical protein